MRDERRRRRFAVGAGNGDEGRVRAKRRALAAEELDVADDLDTRRAGEADAPVRLGMGERHAGRQHEGGEARPVGRAQVLDIDAGGAGGIAPGLAVVPGDDIRATGDERLGPRRGAR
eukprot:gene19779-20255_t